MNLIRVHAPRDLIRRDRLNNNFSVDSSRRVLESFRDGWQLAIEGALDSHLWQLPVATRCWFEDRVERFVRSRRRSTESRPRSDRDSRSSSWEPNHAWVSPWVRQSKARLQPHQRTLLGNLRLLPASPGSRAPVSTSRSRFRPEPANTGWSTHRHETKRYSRSCAFAPCQRGTAEY